VREVDGVGQTRAAASLDADTDEGSFFPLAFEKALEMDTSFWSDLYWKTHLVALAKLSRLIVGGSSNAWRVICPTTPSTAS
jgi:hypothetical protein